MARIFSWHIKDSNGECFSYLATSGTSGTYSAGSMVLDDKITSDSTLRQIADVVSAYTEQVYKTQFNNMVQKVANKGFNVPWKDYSYYYDVDGNNLIMLTGVGEKGEAGIQGIQGPKGDTGLAGNGRNVMCYCGLPEGFVPTRANVTGGKFYPNKWEITYPTDPVGVTFCGVTKTCVWQDSNEFDPGIIVWMTNADFPSSTGTALNEKVDPIAKSDGHGGYYTWATPIQISGPKGDNGADGDSIEFVYKRARKRTDPVPSRPTGTTEEQAMRQGWTDHPSGISEDYKVEYMSQHTKDPETKEWGEFSEPALWASWGEDGIDGDGLEYIFAVTSAYSTTGIINKRPKSTDARLKNHWQDPEIWDFIKLSGYTSNYSPWTDDPSDVSQDEPYEWVSIRRRKWNAEQNDGVFGEFSEPKLWAHWGKNGEKGDDGTSINIKGTNDTLGHLLKDLKPNVPGLNDSYVIGEDGSKHVYVWIQQDDSFNEGRSEYTTGTSANFFEKPDSEVYTKYYYKKDNKYYWFTDCGTFAGEDGKSAYVHMKYAKDWTGQTGVEHMTEQIADVGQRDICFTSNGGETPGPYIAMYTDSVFDDRADLNAYHGLWCKWEGDDGQSFGQEQIFLRTLSLIDTATTELIKTATEDAHGYERGEKYLNVSYTNASFNTVDWVPAGWSDVPMGIVPGTYNFEYSATRRLLEDGTWSYFSIPALSYEAVDKPNFQIEYTTWSGETKPVLTHASAYTTNGIFDENAWRANERRKNPSIIWTDENSKDTTWMAQCNGYFENSDPNKLIWNDWIVLRTKGIDGQRGNGRNIMAFCCLPEGYVPTTANVTGGKFYPNKWQITFPTDNVGITVGGVKKYCSWGDSNEPDDPSYMVWMTNADFPNSTGTSVNESVDPIEKSDGQGGTYTWTDPICITGPKGDNGADGDSIEFIYFRTTGKDKKPDWPNDSPQIIDYLPEAYVNGVDTGEKWKDSPQGIDTDNTTEWMCQRTKNARTGLWSQWTPVSLWSHWGEDGMDGDGVEYIFATAATLGSATTSALYAKVPKSTDARLKNHWQDPEIWDFIKLSGYTRYYSPWTDDPSDVSPEEPYEYVSIRRRKYLEASGNSVFYEFEEPALWARWADDGESVFTSFAFTNRRNGDDISKCVVSGGSYDSPIPTITKSGSTTISMTWTDAPTTWPDSVMAVSGAPVVWMVSAVFEEKNGVSGQTRAWTKPKNMTDTADFETMYSPCSGAALNDIRAISGFTKIGIDIEQGWLNRAKAKGWFDEVEDIPSASGGAVYMATINGTNGKFNDQDWQVMQIKGEKGEPGPQGPSGATGVSKFKSIVYKRSSSKPSKPSASQGSYENPVPSGSGWYDTVISGTGEVWMTSRTFASDGTKDEQWADVVSCIDNEYVDFEWNKYWTTWPEINAHKPLKNSPNQTVTPENNNYWYDGPIEGAIWMAVRQVNNGAYEGNWEISKIKGEDGSSQSDLEYLKDIFPNVDASADTATLRGFLGVMSGNSDVVAFLNGTSGISDTQHGTLMIAAGVDSMADANNAKFRVYEDGTLCAKDAEIDGKITASTGNIGGISINSSGIGITNEENGFFLGSDGSININNKNVQITNNGIFFKGSNGDNVLSVVNKAYHSLSAFTGTMSGGSTTVSGSKELVFAENNFEMSSTVDFRTQSNVYDIPGTTFTVLPGATNKVTVHVEDSIVLTLAVLDSTIGLNFGSGFLDYMFNLSIVNESNEEFAIITGFPMTTIIDCSTVLRMGSLNKIVSVPSGTYRLAVVGYAHVTGNISGTIPSDGYHWKFFLDLNNSSHNLIDSIPSISGVEIFRNGLAIKNGPSNYLFAAAPDEADEGGPERLIVAIMSGGRGIYFSGGTSWVTYM